MEQTTTEQSVAPASESQAPSPQTLDDVYREHGIEEQAQQFSEQRQSPQHQAPNVPNYEVPDPLDTNAYKQYEVRKAMEQSALNQTLQQTIGVVTKMHQEALQKSVEADIKSAVDTINKDLNMKPKLVEALLEATVKENPKLQTIWNNRAKNPKALEAALKVLSGQFASDYAVRQDPQLVENQRAVKASQQSMATTQKSSQNDDIGNMPKNDFDKWWKTKKYG